jgi:ABC-type lipoprotein export system ATPase subunit
VTLFVALARQRERIAFFEPVIFHAHSIDSFDWGKRDGADRERNDPRRLETDAGVQTFLDELASNYRVVCITDHMRSGYACRLARAALQRDDITVLPGMEINCLAAPHFADAIHLLAVFPPETEETVIERIFEGQELVGASAREGKETVRFADLAELRDRIRRKGMFVVAHVENERRGHRARFRLDRGKTLALYSEGRQLELELAEEYGVYLANLEPDAVELQRVEDQRHYGRFTVAGQEHRVACVAPADHHCFEDYDRNDSATFLKVPRCDFASVREALRFHATRVRLPGQVTEHAAPSLMGLRMVSPTGAGLFTETTVAFSPNLTCLIGPRGSGKSTVIEALRYVLGRNEQLAERAGREVKSFADLAQGTQRANLRDTRLELLYKGADGRETVLEAAFDESEPVTTRAFSPDGHDLNVNYAALAADFPVAIFSWSEMEVLGREPGPQRDLVDRLLGGARDLLATREGIRGQLARNREEIAALIGELNRARSADGGRLGRFRQYRDRYATINSDEAAALFEGLDRARKRKELLESVASELTSVRETADCATEMLVAGRVEQRVALESNELREWWVAGPGPALALDQLDNDLTQLADGVRHHVAERETTLASLQAAAVADTLRVEEELRAQTRLDDSQDLLRDQRELARERFEQVDGARATYLDMVERLDGLLVGRSRLLADLGAAQDAISAHREGGLEPLNAQLADVAGDRLRIAVEREQLADRRAAEEFLDEHILTQTRAGRYKQQRIAERLCAMGTPATLSAALVETSAAALGAELAVGADGALDAEEADKLVAGCIWRKSDEDAEVDVVDTALIRLLELAEQPIDDRVRIKLNGKPVDELSPGQRSSAMLPLIALAETDPLIIDQPEDNLDNAMVGETLTRILADLKERRQIIVSTHNPNIVVSGDAEQVVVLDAQAAHRADITVTGSIDDSDVIEAVLTVMEGGREAFIARRKRYRLD